MAIVHELAETYREKLGWKPWDVYRREALDRISKMVDRSDEWKARHLAEERQTGRTAKGLLYAIAEAKLIGWPLVVIGHGGSDALHAVARDLVNRLELDLSVHKRAQGPFIVYVDHLVGYVSRVP